MYYDIIMNDSTFISKLPDKSTNGGSIQNNFQENINCKSSNQNNISFNQNNLPQIQNNAAINTNTYTPLNDVHPNPYGFKNDIDVSLKQDQMHRLPSRDIPIDQTTYTQDEEVKVNYIEEPKNMKDYIQDYKQEESERIRIHNLEKNALSRFDKTVSELQEFILISIMYFISYLPIITTLMKKYLNILGMFEADGNLNLRGKIFKSLSFATFYYTTFQAINRLFPTM